MTFRAAPARRAQPDPDAFNPNEPWRVVNVDEAARVCGVSTDTLIRMSRRGEGPPVVRLSPRRIGYRTSAVLAWLEAQSGETTPGPARKGKPCVKTHLPLNARTTGGGHATRR